MPKWADYLISAVRYNDGHTHITHVRAHEDTGDSLGEEKTYARQTIVDAINNGTTFLQFIRIAMGYGTKAKTTD